MADHRDGEIRWYTPEMRGIIPLDSLRISRSLQQSLNKNLFELRFNTSFEGVMRACAERKDTWISEAIVLSYVQLHSLGFAHSVEAWKDGELAGGLYGVALGAAFFGESMFSRRRDGSKVALVHLVNRLRTRKFELLDTQFVTPHLAALGAVEIPRDEYLARLRKAIRKKRSFTD
jgi:leucyl/phenylalanyl-tRNA--protein transferase